MLISSKIRSIALGLLMSIFSVGAVNADDFQVYGRDMTYPERMVQSKVNFLGHLGVEYRGRVFNMLPPESYTRRANGGNSNLKATNIWEFVSAGNNYWGSRKARYLNESRAASLLAKSYVYGSRYTYTARTSYARKTIRNGRPQYSRGKYRCDTFVRSVLNAGGANLSRVTTPRRVFNQLYRS